MLYVGDFDPSGMFMSEEDLPARLAKYGGDHITLRRIALTRPQVRGLPSFPAADKKQGPALQVVRRQLWATSAGSWTRWTPTICAIASSRRSAELIEPVAWERCEVVNKAEQELAANHSVEVEGAMTAMRSTNEKEKTR